MSQEIERKFWLRSIPDYALQTPSENILSIDQAYLKVDETGEIRIRKTHNHGTDIDMQYLTVKSKGGLMRDECEEYIPATLYRALIPHTKANPIIKTRYRVQRHGVMMEFDLFHGHLNGLVVLEIEFKSADDARAFSLPADLGARLISEVTEDKLFKNSSLAFADAPPTP